MNRTEERYAREALDMRVLAGDIASYGYESVKLRLAPATFYTPDFLVIRGDGLVEFHEVKGHWEDDARVKTKTVARLFPWFRFLAVRPIPKREGGGWSEEVFPAF